MAVDKVELRRLTIQRDMVGTIHIKSGDFDYVQIRYQYPYTDNASTQRLAEQVVDILEGRSEVEHISAERDAALAEIEAYRKDAERYRWLREQECEDGLAILPIGTWVKPAMLCTTPFDSAEMVDSVVDAAMAHAKEIGND